MENKKHEKILIIGAGGGREHAVGWKIAQSERCGKLFFARGNAGTAELGENLDLKETDLPALLNFAKTEKIDLTLALSDDPLALGIVDLFQKEGLRIWGPSKAAAKLEWSKAYAKEFMKQHHLPTATFETFTDFNKAKEYIEARALPIVIKASGLALGKGVVIAQTKEEALATLESFMVKKVFGPAGEEIVIEEYLKGPEVSIHAFSDGKNYAMFPPAQDHKRIGENDTGPNTGGMGSVAPVSSLPGSLLRKIENEVVAPTFSAMSSEGNPFSGVLFPGLMLTEHGHVPKILEFNARLGDPETQTYMRILETDLLDIIDACIDGTLEKLEVKWKDRFACTVVLASGGYPGEHEKGKVITGVKEADKHNHVVIFHAGTRMEEGQLVTNGGRVLGVSATGHTLEEALSIAYEAIGRIHFEGMQYRRDIGKKVLIMLR